MPGNSKRKQRARPRKTARPRLDFQEHLADLEAQGLLVRVDRPINKDTELQPLVRWQFVGGIPEDEAPRLSVHQRRRCQGPALRYSGGDRRARGLPADLRGRHGKARRGNRRDLDARHRESDCAGHRQVAGVPAGRDHRRRAAQARWRARAPARADFDAGFRRRAVPDGDAVHHARSRERHPEHGHLPRRAQGHRPARRAHGRARRRRRRLSALAQVPRAQAAHADRHRHGLRTGGVLHRPAKTRGRQGRARRWPAGLPARRSARRNASPSTSRCRRTRKSSSKA